MAQRHKVWLQNIQIYISISSLWCYCWLKARRWVPPLNTQCLHNFSESVERSVLTLGSLWLPCGVRETAWSCFWFHCKPNVVIIKNILNEILFFYNRYMNVKVIFQIKDNFICCSTLMKKRIKPRFHRERSGLIKDYVYLARLNCILVFPSINGQA